MRHAAGSLTIGLVLAVVLAACDATNSSPRPSNGLPDITPEPLPTGAASPRPSVCPSDLTSAEVAPVVIELVGPVSREGSEPRLATVTRLRDNDVIYDDPADPGTWEAGWVTGGAPLRLAYEIVGGSPSEVQMTDISALYHPPGDSAWLPLAVEADASGGSVAIPDMAGSARLLVTATWTDGCFAYRGSIRFAFEVIPAAVIAACPSDAAGLDAILTGHRDDKVVIGDVARTMETLGVSARYVPYDSADHVGPFATWDPAAPAVEAATGELLAVADDDDELRLSGGFAKFFRLADPSSTSPEDAVQVSEAALDVDATGRLQVESPADEGRYILELSASWELDCLTGAGITYFSVDISRVVGSLSRPSV